MPNLSRRDLLRASAGAALVAVPMAALASTPALAAADDEFDLDESAEADLGPVMFCVSDAARGEVSILHGTSEVVVQDRRLAYRILATAARASQGR